MGQVNRRAQVRGGYTTIPNWYLLRVLPKVHPSVTAVYLVLRQNFNLPSHRDRVRLSLEELVARTGLARNTVRTALGVLLDLGLIVIARKENRRAELSREYSMPLSELPARAEAILESAGSGAPVGANSAPTVGANIAPNAGANSGRTVGSNFDATRRALGTNSAPQQDQALFGGQNGPFPGDQNGPQDVAFDASDEPTVLDPKGWYVSGQGGTLGHGVPPYEEPEHDPHTEPGDPYLNPRSTPEYVPGRKADVRFVDGGGET